MKTIFFTLLIIFNLQIANAVIIEQKLENPVQERIAKSIFHQLRCVVCSGESIADSRADLALDLRSLVRERIKNGDSSNQIIEYIVSRYGDEILMSPPLKSDTYLLWFGPLIMVMIGALSLFFVLKRQK